MKNGGETAAGPEESDADAAAAKAKKAWRAPKVTRLDGKKGPLNELGTHSDSLALDNAMPS
jgi:hypothetical protein